MVELTGVFAKEAQTMLQDLQDGIDFEKKVITSTHNLEDKLLGFDLIIGHIDFEYVHENITNLFAEISDCIVNLRNELEAIEKQEIHLVLTTQAIKSKTKQWIISHKKIIESNFKAQEIVTKKIIKKIHQLFVQLKEKIRSAEHIFSIDIDNAKVVEIKVELQKGKQEIIHIIEQILRFLITYEHIFSQKLAHLERKEK